MSKPSPPSNHRTTLPQSAALPAPSGREPGRLYHPTGYSLNRGVTGDFHRPYATQKILVFTIHRSTLPQLRCAQQLPQRGSREGCTIQPAARKPQDYGRFSSPLRKAFFDLSPTKSPAGCFPAGVTIQLAGVRVQVRTWPVLSLMVRVAVPIWVRAPASAAFPAGVLDMARMASIFWALSVQSLIS